ncbi:MAG: Ig-like domain-containing protein [Porphyromonas sp.]|nr:Ig-like domain-containing protein [Porphyromonas sp.]
MKRIQLRSLFVLVLLSVFAFTACKKKDPVLVTNVTLNKTSLEIFKGTTEQLTATVTPADAENKDLTWSSSKSNIASVDKTGKVTAIAVGETDITATAGGKVATCKVVVLAVPVSGITLNKTSHEMKIGEEVVLQAAVTPDNAEDKTITWESSNKAVATVSNDGKVVALSEGETNITAKAGAQSAVCKVKVNPIAVESVNINKTSLKMTVGERVKLSAEVLPANATHKTITWSSSNDNVAVVSEVGLVTATGAGKADIIATAGGKSAKCVVEVALPQTPAKVGDYYYEDGTTSHLIDESKKIVGIVFWTGDATLQDKALKRDFPECKNGLVVALKNIDACPWQAEYAAYNKTVGSWIEANAKEYETTVTGEGSVNTNLNKTVGYNNSKALEAFNKAPENAAWPVTAMIKIKEYADANPAPAKTSGWYLPSPKELSLLCYGPYSQNIKDLNSRERAVMNKVNLSLKKIARMGAQELKEATYRSSAERNESVSQGLLFYNSSLQGPKKNAALTARAIFAF